MKLADRLAAKTANVSAKPVDAAAPSKDGPARTSPGRLMDAQQRINTAQARVQELEKTSGHAMRLPLADIVVVPGRKRRLTAEQYAELKGNLEQQPLITPITVRRLEGGKFELVAGHNRRDVYEELGRLEIDAVVIDVDDASAEFAAFFSNLLSPSLSDFEKYWNFKSLQDRTGVTQDDLAKSSGISSTHISRIMKFDRLPEDAKRLLSARPERLGSSAAEKLAEVSGERAEAVVAAIRRLVEDDAFTQTQAVALVSKRPPTVKAGPAYDVKMGRKKICTVSVRDKVIGIRFKDDVEVDVGEWAKKIHELLMQLTASKN